MLHDSQTDLVFLPKALRLHFPSLYKSLTEALELAHVHYREIPRTDSKTHLWVRDWMPITVDKTGSLEQLEYDPDYLRAPRYAKYKPDMPYILDEMGITPFRNNIIVDGGNILSDKKGRVYMTDKVFLENAHIPRQELISCLKQILNARSIRFVHWDKSDMYGHVDGMMAITDDGKPITDLSWEYLNFLRVGNKIFMAQMGKPSDKPALKRIQEAFPDCIVYPIKNVQSLTRLGGGLHCATWNTVEKCYQNAKVFKPSRRHPFNPFSADAFTEKRLRAVVEHGHGLPLSDEHWKAFNAAFRNFWNGQWFEETNHSFRGMVDSMFDSLSEQQILFFNEYEFVETLCNHLYSYLIDVPGLIIPENSKWNPYDIYYPTVHFRDTDAMLTSFKVEFGDRDISYIENLELTRSVELEAFKTSRCEKGIVYVLYYKDDKCRICPHKYIFTARKDNAHITIIMYWDSPITNLTISKYAQKACSEISFYENCFTENPDEDTDKPF